MSPTSSSLPNLPQQLPTVGQLERQLSQALQSHYRRWTGHSPGHILCHLSGQIVNVLIQDSITPLETLLHCSPGQPIRERINTEIRSLLPSLVSESCGVSTSAVMIDSDFDSGQTGIIVLLKETPNVRSRRAKQ